MKTAAVVAGAGSGRRLGLKVRKPFVMLDGVPLIIHCLRTLDSSPRIDTIIVAIEKSCAGRLARLIKRYGLKKVREIVIGGKTRFESVRNCLRKAGNSYDVVLIHDAARPFLDERLIRESVAAAKECGGCIVSVPETDTVKRVNGELEIDATLDRSRIWRAQTPQAFRRSLIVGAYEKASGHLGNVTDDASLLEREGRKVRVVFGSYRNIKITTREDLALARALLSAQRSARGGSAPRFARGGKTPRIFRSEGHLRFSLFVSHFALLGRSP